MQKKGYPTSLGGRVVIGPPAFGGGLGMEVDVIDPEIEPVVLGKPAIGRFALERGWKAYELKNHLGNVLAVVSDLKIGKGVLGAAPLVGHYEADVLEMADYYPFGMVLPKRSWSAGGRYRFGFNGKEQDDAWNGDGNMLNYGFRIDDPRLGRFLSVDPLAAEYAMLTPYQYASNSPIWMLDIDGLEGVPFWYMRPREYSGNGGFLDGIAVGTHRFLTGAWNGVGSIIQGGADIFESAWNADYGGIEADLNHSMHRLENEGVAAFRDPKKFGRDFAKTASDPYNWGGATVAAFTIMWTGKGTASATSDVVITANRRSWFGRQFRLVTNKEVRQLYVEQHGKADFAAPQITTDKQGFLTNGSYRYDFKAQEVHTDVNFGSGKSQFAFRVDPVKAVLDGAAYADKAGLWIGSSAKVFCVDGIVGYSKGQPTQWLNIYRSNNGMVHGAPTLTPGEIK